ncbi:outer membrane lipoprotein carrier protein LolA [Cytobacillus sp. FSL W7-1323]|uniref:DUF4367 domain-containing protein n=1 Tax=Cytobacillus kochii TaxID=859143 RepID=A0A248TGK8_9BACI|nr:MULTISPECIES: outer membrane lipoprotein carrier protein LolA [Cytobacillus]ASV67252.1 DUF4367 domain-containing protein [Cytobacillus kochii]MCA1027927.1 outer membrane lipoprotein carrier protein LolA [Cytobacillus kochii]MCM3323838.1 outer membrane lipoprotein carrier protein LolA [Cytobacillus kochii]MCM3346235.1 outer membrane lipoprotein carrier protein LolA [Cytobacillus kochii]MDM5205907.1 outer membrane lipoprotein carrier protein LolA [Cytobacillus kochii]
MKKKFFWLLMGLAITVTLAACGTKSQEDVTKDLSSKLESLKSYKAEAKMTLQTGSEPQSYDIEIWHKNPEFYRVALKNTEKDQSQMILKNKEGVFVLTPALNKSFRFQSDWPNNSSQAYLYESLIEDIQNDKEAKFKATEDHYVYETKTSYQNNQMLPLQEITLNKSDLSPVSVKVMDAERTPVVTVDFSNVKFNEELDNKDFDTKKNMTGAQLEFPVMAEVAEEEDFTVFYPESLPEVELVSEKEVETEEGKRVILTYEGEDKSFTMIQEKAVIVQTSGGEEAMMNGDPVDLGFTVGAVSDNMVSWTQNGVDYMIASTNLSKEEMIQIAQSVQGEVVK